MDNIANETLKAQVKDRLNNISTKMKTIDHEAHTALLYSIMGGLKAQAGFNPVEMNQVIGAVEIIVDDFLINEALRHSA